ncbi:hypothetical protein LTR86_006133 [Recurvomyces mirabilis]|nr:hypothetical protein LTR86_006133 [Recurvomyces mirabilis]
MARSATDAFNAIVEAHAVQNRRVVVMSARVEQPTQEAKGEEEVLEEHGGSGRCDDPPSPKSGTPLKVEPAVKEGPASPPSPAAQASPNGSENTPPYSGSRRGYPGSSTAAAPPPASPPRHPSRGSLEEVGREGGSSAPPVTVTERSGKEGTGTGRQNREDSVEDEFLKDGREKAESPEGAEGSGSGSEDGEDSPGDTTGGSKSRNVVSSASSLPPGQKQRPARYHGCTTSEPGVGQTTQSEGEAANPGLGALGAMSRLSIGPTSDPRAPHRQQPTAPRVQTAGPRQKRRKTKGEQEDPDAIAPAPPLSPDDEDISPFASPSGTGAAFPPYTPRQLSAEIRKQGGLTENPGINVAAAMKSHQSPTTISPGAGSRTITSLQPSRASPSPQQRRGWFHRTFTRGRHQQEQQQQGHQRDLMRNSLAVHRTRLNQAQRQAQAQTQDETGMQSGRNWRAQPSELRRGSGAPTHALTRTEGQASDDLEELRKDVERRRSIRFAEPSRTGSTAKDGSQDGASEIDKAGSRDDVSRTASNARSAQWEGSLAEYSARGNLLGPAVEAQEQQGGPRGPTRRQRQQGGILGGLRSMGESMYAGLCVAITFVAMVWGLLTCQCL